MSHITSTAVTSQEKPEIYTLEEKILKLSGLTPNEDLFVYDVPIKIKNKPFQIHTYRCGDNNKEDLVLLHGYGGCSLLYYPMLKELAKKFRVFCIDFAGMGLSSKEHFDSKSTEEAIEFFVENIENWRQAVGIETFYLAGHSFGGYISGQYTLRHQDKVKKLFLLSPIGITKHKEERTVEQVKQELGFFKGLLYGFFMRFWEQKMTPNRFITEHPWIGKFIMKNYISKRFNMRDSEAEMMQDFFMKMLTLPEGSQLAIHYVLKPPRASAQIPLEEFIVEQMTVPVVCFFGENDYMDMTGANRVQEAKSKGFVIKRVPKAAHQLTIQNGQYVAEEIIVESNV